MLLLLTAHLSLNYAAVRAVSMQSLNRQRANILFSHLLAYNKVLTPKEVAKRERVFEEDGVLRWSNDQVIGSARIGVSLEEVAQHLAASQQPLRKKTRITSDDLTQLLDIFKGEDYVVWFDTKVSKALILLNKGIGPSSQLKAWCQALLIAEEALNFEAQSTSMPALLNLIARSLKRTTKLFEDHKQTITNAGWLVDIAALETQSGVRLVRMH
jgi:hypothetical protein